MRTIEERHELDDPAPPPPEIGWVDVLWCVLIPVFGLVQGLICLTREKVGVGLVYLLLGAMGSGLWLLAASAVS